MRRFFAWNLFVGAEMFRTHFHTKSLLKRSYQRVHFEIFELKFSFYMQISSVLLANTLAEEQTLVLVLNLIACFLLRFWVEIRRIFSFSMSNLLINEVLLIYNVSDDHIHKFFAWIVSRFDPNQPHMPLLDTICDKTSQHCFKSGFVSVDERREHVDLLVANLYFSVLKLGI